MVITFPNGMTMTKEPGQNVRGLKSENERPKTIHISTMEAIKILGSKRLIRWWEGDVLNSFGVEDPIIRPL